MWSYIDVELDGSHTLCAVLITSIQLAVGNFPLVRVQRRSSSRISAAVPGMLSVPRTQPARQVRAQAWTPPTVYIREDRLVAKINGWMPDSSVLNTSRTPSPRLSTLRTVLAPAETAQAALRCRIMWPRSPVPDSDHACG
jgi:hypothetical protein